ncbi:MAG: hypothetical protein DRG31_06715 [Deltaproteobacteria bacterium]|nr:MAG: hypothetical protein DRG31_06715 [Deltaproteobacteria bacterium]
MAGRAFTFALFAALCWGIAPIFGKMGLLKAEPSLALALRSFVVALVLLMWGVAGGWLKELGTLVGTREGVYIAIEGLLASFVGHLAYFYALKYGEASRMVPVTSSFPLFALFFALLLLREELAWDKVFGALLIVAGIILLRR